MNVNKKWLKEENGDYIAPRTLTSCIQDENGNSFQEYVDNMYNIIAPPYDATKTYFTGNYCIKDNILYVCNTDITTPEQFTASNWIAVTCEQQLNNANLKINALENTKSNKTWISFQEGTNIDITSIYDNAWEYYVLFTDNNNVTTEFFIPWQSIWVTNQSNGRILINGYYYDSKYSASHSIRITQEVIEIYTPWTRVVNNGAVTTTGTIKVYYR